MLHNCEHPPEPSEAFGLWLGFAALLHAAPLRWGDMHEDDTLTLDSRSSGPRWCE